MFKDIIREPFDAVDDNSMILDEELHRNPSNVSRSKVDRYWEEKFKSGELTQKQISILMKIPANEYESYNAKDMGLTEDNVIFQIPKRKNTYGKMIHKIDMYQGIYVYYDPCLLEEYDEENSTIDEDRYRIIGIASNEVLVTVYCEITSDTVRIITVFPASEQERKQYEYNKFTKYNS